jgi:hypothetical protein
MKKVHLLNLFIFIISISCFSQQSNDSSQFKVKQAEKKIIPAESFKLFTNPLMFKMNSYAIDMNNTYSNSFIPLGFVTSKDYIIQLNKKEFFQQIYANYQLSKPGLFQEILGMVQMGAVAALAGYHIYKYEIKKEKK